MATVEGRISTYDLHFDHGRGKTPAQPDWRTKFIHLRFEGSAPQLTLFILSFVPDRQAASTGEVIKLSDGTFRASARIPADEFSQYYDMLRKEKPVSVRLQYDAEPAAGQSAPITSFSVFTGPEPVGEGEQDTSA
ncbi:hypothetical protein BN8_01060 [Fibrisoma limi BUZ 3]|uniref:Uncharacterized protein n=1 Tax=Fibrisoma limi BUZ 3 TaxID=1185876 RepID=I2GDW3_9BACT|nr:hypothetical protein [Fibrisoma limi]CCH52087.1 hypothetical protein BN8_01060 [Fibrisoma limi BUZ 3]